MTPSKQQELKSCPHCNGPAVTIEVDHLNYTRFITHCDDDRGCSGGGFMYCDSEEKSIAEWNKRALEDAKDQRIAKLEEGLRVAKSALNEYWMLYKGYPQYLECSIANDALTKIDALLGDTEGKK